MAGTTAGRVVDIRSSQPIDGASVVAQPGDHTTTAGNDGAYSLALPAGTYSMTVTKDGYDPFIGEGIVVIDDVNTEIKVGLSLATD